VEPSNALTVVFTNRNVYSRRLKVASVAFGLRTGSGKLFQSDGPARKRAESVPLWYVQ